MKKYKIAVLDDYQNVALESADWSGLRERQRTGNTAYRLRIAWSLRDVLRGYRLEHSEVARRPLAPGP